MSEKESVARKIRKLLALAKSPNANEAASATAKARRMLIEHGLTERDLGEDPGEVGVHVWREFEGAVNSCVGQLVSVVASASMCRAVIMDAGKTHQWGLIGKASNTEAASAQLDFLFASMEGSLVFAGAGRGRTWRNDYRLGWVLAISEFLAEEVAQDTPEQHGLVVVENRDVQEFCEKQGMTTRQAKITRDVDEEALLTGMRHGERVGRDHKTKKLK